MSDLLVTFADANDENPYQLAREWGDVSRLLHLRGSVDGELDQLARMAVLIDRLTRWLPLQIHAALRAGASLDDVEAATSLTRAEIWEAWNSWAGRQRRYVYAGNVDELVVFDQVEQLFTGKAAINELKDEDGPAQHATSTGRN